MWNHMVHVDKYIQADFNQEQLEIRRGVRIIKAAWICPLCPILYSPLEKTLDSQEDLAQDLLTHIQERLGKVTNCKSQFRGAVKQGKCFSVYKGHGNLCHDARYQAEKGKEGRCEFLLRAWKYATNHYK